MTQKRCIFSSPEDTREMDDRGGGDDDGDDDGEGGGSDGVGMEQS